VSSFLLGLTDGDELIPPNLAAFFAGIRRSLLDCLLGGAQRRHHMQASKIIAVR